MADGLYQAVVVVELDSLRLRLQQQVAVVMVALVAVGAVVAVLSQVK
jgi:hypothetical protein